MSRKPGANAVIELNDDCLIKSVSPHDVGIGIFYVSGVRTGCIEAYIR